MFTRDTLLRRSAGPAAMAGAVLLATAFPPADQSWLAWLAVIPWLWLITLERLPGRRPYAWLFAAGWVYWLLVLHWLRLPHWATALGWPLLAGYLAVYTPLFVAITRAASKRIPTAMPWIASLVWMGLEYLRGCLFSGFSMACLGHTQHSFTALIQIAELGGATLVGGLVLLPAAVMLQWQQPQVGLIARGVNSALVSITLGLTLVFGLQRMDEPLQPILRAGLIQGSIDTVFEFDPRRNERVMTEYLQLTRVLWNEAAARAPSEVPQLLVWPESMCRMSHLDFSADFQSPPEAGIDPAKFAAQRRSDLQVLRQELVPAFARDQVSLLLGIDREFLRTPTDFDRFNSALFVSPTGETATYDKVHCVPFGEYIPLGEWLPILYRLTPLPGGLKAGAGPKVFTVPVAPFTLAGAARDSVRIAPSICYETVMPWVLRRQVLDLHAAGTPVDLLVNVTNDGWFWGSSELDLHLICGQFRAIENRRPLLIAANTGFSAAIDPLGRITAQGKRRATDTLNVSALAMRNDGPEQLTFFTRYGELPGACGLLLAGIVILVGGYRALCSRRATVLQ